MNASYIFALLEEQVSVQDHVAMLMSVVVY